ADGKEYIFVDTAGLRRKAQVDETLETISALKSIQAMEDSDVVLLILDAKDIVSKQDKRIASLAIAAGKGLILVLNKADLLTTAERKEKETETRAALSFARFSPLLFVSALTRDGLPKLFPLITTVHNNRLRRISTSELRRWYETAIAHIPAHELSRSKYVTQAEGLPPTFVVFVRNPKKVAVSQLRALENNIRSVFSFEGVPLRWVTKGQN
ncbi:GTP-binding protein, partial [Candidatus Peregrinibacteria bacterium]|nr:GTP-binding protein [Candidatus Peregrinibacteria bacterium]